jgi:hypothetical protein
VSGLRIVSENGHDDELGTALEDLRRYQRMFERGSIGR